MVSKNSTSPAMTLEHMREIGVRSIEATCECGHKAIVDVSGLPSAIEVPALRHRFRCVECGGRPNDVRPNWLEYRARESHIDEQVFARTRQEQPS